MWRPSSVRMKGSDNDEMMTFNGSPYRLVVNWRSFWVIEVRAEERTYIQEAAAIQPRVKPANRIIERR